MKSIRSRVATVWCQVMHPAPMWPVNGYYQCPACLRAYPVPWEQGGRSRHAADQQVLSNDPAETVASRTAVAALASR